MESSTGQLGLEAGPHCGATPDERAILLKGGRPRSALGSGTWHFSKNLEASAMLQEQVSAGALGFGWSLPPSCCAPARRPAQPQAADLWPVGLWLALTQLCVVPQMAGRRRRLRSAPSARPPMSQNYGGKRADLPRSLSIGRCLR